MDIYTQRHHEEQLAITVNRYLLCLFSLNVLKYVSATLALRFAMRMENDTLTYADELSRVESLSEAQKMTSVPTRHESEASEFRKCQSCGEMKKTLADMEKRIANLEENMAINVRKMEAMIATEVQLKDMQTNMATNVERRMVNIERNMEIMERNIQTNMGIWKGVRKENSKE